MVPAVLGAVERAARLHPHRPSLIEYSQRGCRQFSCEDVAEGMLRWAGDLSVFQRSAARPGEDVAVIVMRHGFAAYASFLGGIRAGFAACFLPRPNAKQDPLLYWANHRDVLARIAPAVVVCDEDLLEQLRAVLLPGTPLLSDAGFPGRHAASLPVLEEVEHDDVPALLQHSSGTTGLKKGVVLTHGQIRRQVQSYAAALSVSPEDTVASWLPLYHDMGLITGFLMPLCLGLPIVCMDPFDWLARPDSILAAIKRFRASLCWLPNFAFAHLCNTADDEADYDLSSLRALVDCSEPCRADTLAAFQARFARHGLRPGAVTTCYAMAETVFAVTQSPPGQALRVLFVDADRLSAGAQAVVVPEDAPGAIPVVSCGQPIAGSRLRIAPLSNNAAPSPTDRGNTIAGEVPRGCPVGEIHVQSSWTFQGYHRDPAASAACLDGGWYKTGDLGFQHGGELYVTGRLKELIIVNGRNFYAHDIEAAASSVPGVKPGRAVAFSIERASAGSDGAVVLAESLSGGSDNTALARRIGQAVFDLLGLTLHHVGIRQAGVLVKTTSGKLCRHENRRRYAEEMKV